MITLTEEQQACISAAKLGQESLLINALAGAAKTTTLVHIAQALPIVPTLCVAFNKRISEEMAKRMPSHITCQTMNSVGHRAWGAHLGRRLILDSDKMYNLVTEASKALSKEDRERIIGDEFGSVLRAVRLCKSYGYIPPGSSRRLGDTFAEQEDLVETFARQLDLDASPELFRFIDKVLETSITLAFEGKIDFDDQIYMPTLFRAKFSQFPIVMVDEAQDLSPLNHLTLKKLCQKRLIAVGDPHQAIYGFRGASHSSMQELKFQFNMKELTLSTSFRCPKTVVLNAHWRVPHMRFPDWAQEGTVKHLEEWSPSVVPDGAAIICRNNSPVFSIGLKLIRAGRGIKLLGNDIGKNLIKIMKGLGPGNLPRAQALAALAEWETQQLKKAHKARHASISDRTRCIEVFLEAGETLDHGIAYAEVLFNSSGPIQLMTGHKSKGGEWPVVFHLDPFLVPSHFARKAAEQGDSAQMEQELNLKYVIETRAQECLYFVNSEDFVP